MPGGPSNNRLQCKPAKLVPCRAVGRVAEYLDSRGVACVLASGLFSGRAPALRNRADGVLLCDDGVGVGVRIWEGGGLGRKDKGSQI